MDSEELFNENIKHPVKRKYLESHGFMDPKRVLTYQFNSQGFRCNEFDQSLGVITLGCSFTMGIGLHLEDVWPSVVAKHFGWSCWNLGVGGCSFDTCFRILHNYIGQLNAKYVLVAAPSKDRFEFFTNRGLDNFMSSQITHPIQKYWYDNDANGELNFYKNSLAIQQLCRQHGKKCIIRHVDTVLYKHEDDTGWPAARDLQHAGAKSQKRCAQYYIDAIKTGQANL